MWSEGKHTHTHTLKQQWTINVINGWEVNVYVGLIQISIIWVWLIGLFRPVDLFVLRSEIKWDHYSLPFFFWLLSMKTIRNGCFYICMGKWNYDESQHKHLIFSVACPHKRKLNWPKIKQRIMGEWHILNGWSTHMSLAMEEFRDMDFGDRS